ncbi:L10-interacting MYB domain-containing protein-like isoform X2 [Apium graveolens]|uniref:L10-interacting MYB domain-containing protein-like isoform X2 n=1 Tax=Apium graveolens TaxID=4045 RepID=UPI003D7A6FE2
MNVIERKKKNVHKAIASLITELKDFEALLESSTAEILNHEAQKSRQEKSNVGSVERLGLDKNELTNPMNEKQKDCEFSEKKIKEMWKKVVGKEREVEGKVKEVEFSKRFVEERALELELRQKELDDGFRELEKKKMEIASTIAGIKCAVTVKQERRYSAKWDDSSHRIYIKLCVNEVRKGNRPCTTLSKTGWANVHKEFIAITGITYTIKQLKNHWDAMKADWTLFDQLRQRHTLLGWNQEKKTIDADDAWWNDQIKINPKYAKFKNKDLSVFWSHYDILFSDDVATENRALVPAGPSTYIKLKGEEDYLIDEDNAAAAAAVEGAEGTESSDSQASRQPGNDYIQIPVAPEERTSSGTKRKKGAMSPKDDIDSLVNIMPSKSTESSFHTAEAPSITECMDKLEEIDGIKKTTPLYWYSQNLFTRPDMRTIFMKQRCDSSRVGWLEFNYSEYLNKKSA